VVVQPICAKFTGIVDGSHRPSTQPTFRPLFKQSRPHDG